MTNLKSSLKSSATEQRARLDAATGVRPSSRAAALPRSALALSIFFLLAFTAASQPFQLPTANHALFEKGREEDFFVGTVGKPWTTGTFGCVRSDGNQLHEGLDIRCLQRDKHGEPTDAVMATADGTVAYINTRPSLSNYGKYLVLRHRIEDIEVYSLYAHLHGIREGLKTGQSVKAGEVIAIMGRTANTHEGISKDRAHVHFELNLMVSERFASWFKKNFPDQRDDHGVWNGQNLLGLDPRLILLQQHSDGAKFSLLDFIRHQNELCRVLIRKTDFPWVKRYSALVRQNPLVGKGAVAGYEVALNFNGIPFELTPRTASEIKGKAKFQLLSVNEAEDRKNPCRHLVTRRGAHWELTNHGEELFEMLSY